MMDLQKLKNVLVNTGPIKLLLISVVATLFLNLILPFPGFVLLLGIPIFWWLKGQQ